MLEDLDFEVVGSKDNAEEAVAEIKKLNPELVLLDIQLAGSMTGIDLAEELRLAGIPFLFLTAQSDVATIEKAKKTKPYAYLIKPVNKDNLLASIEISLFNAKEYLINQPERLNINDKIFVKTSKKLERINIKDILWIEAEDIYAILNTAKSKFVLSQPLKSIETRLPDNFMRIHRSFIINLDSIDSIIDNDVVIAEKYIPIGKTYRDALMGRLDFL